MRLAYVLPLWAPGALAYSYDDWCSPGDDWCRSLFFGGPPCPAAVADAAGPLRNDSTPELAALFEDLPNLMEDLRARTHSPAAFVAVVQGGEVLWSGGTGSVTVDGAGPAPSLDTGFRIASISKVFTSFLAFKLRDAGVLSLDDPVEKWLPSFAPVQARARELFPKVTRPVTLGSLAMHASGLVRAVPGLDGGSTGDDPVTEELLMARLAAEPFPFLSPPLTASRYSNLGVRAVMRSWHGFPSCCASASDPM